VSVLIDRLQNIEKPLPKNDKSTNENRRENE
jgi:hypothetical protein